MAIKKGKYHVQEANGLNQYHNETTASQVIEETNKRFVTDAQKNALNAMGSANGVAKLDGSGKIPATQLPTSAMEYKGSFGSAASSTGGDLPSGANQGDQYTCDTNGYASTRAGITFNVGDMALFDGTNWVKIDSSDAVHSVNGKTGTVTINKGDIGLGSVANYGVATQTEAEAGTSSSKYMTPLRVKQAILMLAPRMSDEEIEDIVGAMFTGNSETNITLSYDDASGKINASVANASTSQKGVVQLSNSVNSTSASLAATPAAVKQVNDLASSKNKVVVSSTTPSGLSNGDVWLQEV